jgi:ABC-type branched-subunit amino acid transport system substrate-binding protein
MRISSNFRFAALFLFVIITLPLTGCAEGDGTSGDTDSGNEEVLVAANLPLSGNLAATGEAIRTGAEMALDTLNESGDGPSLRFDWKDNSSSPSEAVSILQQQLMRSPDVYVSGIKPQTMAVMDQVGERGLPHFVWIFDIRINQGQGNNFRTLVNYKLEPQVHLQYAQDTDAERVAIIYAQLPHTIEAYEEVLAPALRSRGKTVNLISYDPGKRDFKDIAERVDNFNPDMTVLNGFQQNIVSLVRAFRPLGLVENSNTIASFDMLDAAEVLGDEEVEGIRVVAPEFVTRPYSERMKSWTKQFKEQYGKDPRYLHAYAYDMTRIIKNAAKRLDLPAASEEWIQAISETNMQGITGPLRFDERGSLTSPLEVGVYRDGRLVPDTTVTVPDTLALPDSLLPPVAEAS